MKAKPIIPRALANRDVSDAVDYYAREGGEAVALGFVTALEQLYRAIGRNPGLGSPRFAHELDLPGLRCRRVKRHPYIAFYIEHTDYIDVWRVLHVARDIPVRIGLEHRADD